MHLAFIGGEKKKNPFQIIYTLYSGGEKKRERHVCLPSESSDNCTTFDAYPGGNRL